MPLPEGNGVAPEPCAARPILTDARCASASGCLPDAGGSAANRVTEHQWRGFHSILISPACLTKSVRIPFSDFRNDFVP